MDFRRIFGIQTGPQNRSKVCLGSHVGLRWSQRQFWMDLGSNFWLIWEHFGMDFWPISDRCWDDFCNEVRSQFLGYVGYCNRSSMICYLALSLRCPCSTLACALALPLLLPFLGLLCPKMKVLFPCSALALALLCTWSWLALLLLCSLLCPSLALLCSWSAMTLPLP